MNYFKKEFWASLILVVLAIFVLNPFNFWMPNMAVYVALLAVLFIFVFYFGLILKEKPLDEREDLHLKISSRAGYLTGLTALTVVFLYQSLTGYPDKEVVAVLVLMILGKLIAFAISKKRM